MVETAGRHLLAEKLARKGWTQAYLAGLLEIEQSSVSQWITGAVQPRTHHRFALWILLRIPVDAWFTVEELALIDRVTAYAATLKKPKKARSKPSITAAGEPANERQRKAS
jgi:transcriptional regulator with XRE-family HTH domain